MSEQCTQPCLGLSQLEHRVEELTAKNGESHREIFRRLNALEQADAVQTEQYKTILEKLDDLTQKVDALEAKPAKRWEGLVERVVWAVAAAVIAFLLARVGLG